jgi:radical SAM protein with 4Fe4S-binding SPASM domain
MIYARENGLKVGLSLNPIALTDEKIIRLIDAEPYELYIMLDGNDEASFSAIRGVKGMFERSKENALKLADYKQERNTSTKLQITAVNVPQNQDSILAAQDYWSGVEGVDFYIKEFVTFDGAVKEINQIGESENISRCTKPWTMLTVTWNGMVVPCCYDYNAKYPLGNVKDDSLSNIWNNERMVNLRNEFDDYKIANELCKLCELGGRLDSGTVKSPKHNLRYYIRKIFETAKSERASVLLYGIGSRTTKSVADIVAEYAGCMNIYGSDLSIKADTAKIDDREISLVGTGGGGIQKLSPRYIIILIRDKEMGEEAYRQLLSLDLSDCVIYPCHDYTASQWEMYNY